MAHLHDREATSFVIQELVPDMFEHRARENRRAGVEIIDL
jgi:hypothetical protein